ncbi:hypothetical protein [Roseisolibacter agri]|uniref:Uncharacterized protein n=1 Tax=Roseisolibacter agri TaxID=2014610 RepID=A0AA37Q8L2_9BACT|nr:hypothetical protein [Roseisolibacter agri]GLC25036.1 hypothetical protein rosag_15490 [Roseisolibacter agri]
MREPDHDRLRDEHEAAQYSEHLAQTVVAHVFGEAALIDVSARERLEALLQRTDDATLATLASHTCPAPTPPAYEPAYEAGADDDLPF